MPQPARWTRAAALTCAAALSVAPLEASATSGRTLSQAVRAVMAEEPLPEQAEVHLGKAYDHFNAGNFGKAEEEFKRAAFFAPEWKPMTYNLAVVAEARGNLDQAIERYEAYRPHAAGDTGLIVDQRIAELEERKAKIKQADRGKLIVGGVAMGTSVAALGGGIAFFMLRKDVQEDAAALQAQLNDEMSGLTVEEQARLSDDKAALDKKAKNYYVGGYILTLYGGIALLYSALYLAKAVKQRKAKRLALKPTTGGVAVSF
jgi:tetratricopeptide (TPR) repeat protein